MATLPKAPSNEILELTNCPEQRELCSQVGATVQGSGSGDEVGDPEACACACLGLLTLARLWEPCPWEKPEQTELLPWKHLKAGAPKGAKVCKQMQARTCVWHSY